MPVISAAAVWPASSGSSPKLSAAPPAAGSRAMFPAGTGTTSWPAARASRPITAPLVRASRWLKVAARPSGVSTGGVAGPLAGPLAGPVREPASGPPASAGGALGNVSAGIPSPPPAASRLPAAPSSRLSLSASVIRASRLSARRSPVTGATPGTAARARPPRISPAEATAAVMVTRQAIPTATASLADARPGPRGPCLPDIQTRPPAL